MAPTHHTRSGTVHRQFESLVGKRQGLALGRHPRFSSPAVTETGVFGVDASQTIGYALNNDRRALRPAIQGVSCGNHVRVKRGFRIEVWKPRATAVDPPIESGYTLGMKTAVSIPDDVFQQAEQLARRTETSRSALYARALAEYVARHTPDQITDAMNRVCDELGLGVDPFTAVASRRILERSEW